MMRKRFALPTLFLIAVVLALVGTALPHSVRAADETTLTITAIPDNPHSTGSSRFIRVDKGTGSVAYCAQGWLLTPKTGQTLERYGDLRIPELDYVLWHGYDGEVVDSVYGLNATRSEAATAAAVWLAIADQRADVLTYYDRDGTSFHGNKAYMERWESIEDPSVKDAAWKLYQDALAYKQAGGGGVEEGCSCLWLNKTPSYSQGSASFEFQAVVTVEKSRTVTFTKTSARAELTNGNDTYALEGAEYDIFLQSTREKVGSIITDDSGRATMQLKPNTAYYAVETKAPEGFILDPEEIPFTTSRTGGSVALEDEPGSARLVLMKTDAATQAEPQKHLSFQGAEYRISSLSSPGWSKTATTDDKGMLTVSDIPLGTFQVIETKAPAGYLLDQTVHTYTALPGQMNDLGVVELKPEHDFSEIPVSFDIEIAKFNDSGDTEGSVVETPAGGVSFDIISRSSDEVVATITTGNDGFASTVGHWFGAGERATGLSGGLPFDPQGYTVREVASTVPDGFESVDDWNIDPQELIDGVCLRYIVNNSRLTSRLQIVKTDALSGERIPLAGFSFQVFDGNGALVEQEVWHPEHTTISTFTTDETGSVTLPQPLATGTYSIREVEAQPPYVLAQKATTFTVDSKDGEIPPVSVVEIKNERARGSVSITKNSSDDGSALKGAHFDVVALDDLIAPDGTIEAGKGEVVGELITDEQGKGELGGLPLGTGVAHYAVIETKPPQGFALDSTPIPFTLTYLDQQTPLVHAHVSASNAPTTVIVDKTITGSDQPLAEASFGIWNAQDEIAALSDASGTSIALRASDSELEIAIEPVLSDAEMLIDAPDGCKVALEHRDGSLAPLKHGSWIKPGEYTIVASNAADPSQSVRLPLSCEEGSSYTITIRMDFFGIHGSIDHASSLTKPMPLAYNAQSDAYILEDIAPGSYELMIDGVSNGIYTADAKRALYLQLTDGKVIPVPTLLKPDATMQIEMTDERGRITFDHIKAGSYFLCEIQAPEGFIAQREPMPFTVDKNGLIDNSPTHTVAIDNDYTKVELSKRDITNEQEIEGAKLSILDEHDEVVASWVSGNVPHRIDKLPAGTYKLVENLTPRTYDYESSCTFTVLETGDIQHAVLYNRPIRITGEIDKRQEIADPVAVDTVENGDGSNRADVSLSPEGRYRYSLDVRNTSSTWVDEFTFEDTLPCIEQGLAFLESIQTPVATGDFDGLMNVWYRIETDESKAGEAADGDRDAPERRIDDANATLDDGHDNPWLDQPDVLAILGEDARALSYDGWILWASHIPTDAATTLNVSDLALSAHEHVAAVRFEYGRVEKDFHTRSDAWDRDDLKHEHDDLDVIAGAAERDQLAPAVLTLKVTDRYQAGNALENAASVHLYRNGGGPDLEDHDEDRVVQLPKSTIPDLPHTGLSLIPVLVVGGLSCLLMIMTATKRHR